MRNMGRAHTQRNPHHLAVVKRIQACVKWEYSSHDKYHSVTTLTLIVLCYLLCTLNHQRLESYCSLL